LLNVGGVPNREAIKNPNIAKSDAVYHMELLN